MNILTSTLKFLFGNKSGRNVIVETAGAFIPNAENSEERNFAGVESARNQLIEEFKVPRDGFLNDLVDLLNRLPRPLFALGTIWLFAYTAYNPIGAAAIFEAWRLLPFEAWAVFMAIVTYFFGSRIVTKRQAAVDTKEVLANLKELYKLNQAKIDDTPTPPDS